jgi:hypothetical protein
MALCFSVLPLKILNWNIRTFGVTRQKPDVLRQVCRVLEDANAQIVCIQELAVSELARAVSIVNDINNGLTNPYNYILCPHNKLEMYLYLYRNATVEALTLPQTGPLMLNNGGIVGGTFIAHNGNTTAGTGATGLQHYFPLFHYTGRGRSARPPGLGLFRYTDPHNAQHYICLINWHNDARGRRFIQTNIGRLANTPLVNNATFNIQVAGVTRTVNHIVIAADFNDALTTYPFPNAYTRHMTAFTHLHTYNRDNNHAFTTSLHLRDAIYDNILTSLAATLTAGASAIVDLPRRLMDERGTETKRALKTSDLLAQVNQQADYRKRMLSRLPKTRRGRNIIAKKNKGVLTNLLDDTNLGRIRKTRLETQIRGLTVPERQKTIMAEVALRFIEKELTGNYEWAHRLQNMTGLIYNEVLDLTQRWLSDHLPLFVTLNP